MNLTHTAFVHRPTPLELPTVCVVASEADVSQVLGSSSSSAPWQVEQYDSAEAFLARPRALTPACVLTELRLPGLSGLDLQRMLASSGNDIPIIFVTAHADVPLTVRAMKEGVENLLCCLKGSYLAWM